MWTASENLKKKKFRKKLFLDSANTKYLKIT